MGDSDEDVDYNKRSRDKFRTERRGYDSGMSSERGGSPGARREWRDARPGPPSGGSGGWGGGGRGGDRRGYYNDRRGDRYEDRGRHEMSPPAKRMRGGDWGDDGGYERGYGGGGGGYGGDRYNDYDRGHQGGGGGGYRGRSGGGGHYERGMHGGDRGGEGGGGGESSQPLMMSFKAFLATQDDAISDEEALKKYADYKLEFKRQQLNEFFVNHKDEECNSNQKPEEGSGGGGLPLMTSLETPSAEAVPPQQLQQPVTQQEKETATPSTAGAQDTTATTNLDQSKVLNDLVLVMLMLQTRFTRNSS